MRLHTRRGLGCRRFESGQLTCPIFFVPTEVRRIDEILQVCANKQGAQLGELAVATILHIHRSPGVLAAAARLAVNRFDYGTATKHKGWLQLLAKLELANHRNTHTHTLSQFLSFFLISFFFPSHIFLPACLPVCYSLSLTDTTNTLCPCLSLPTFFFTSNTHTLYAYVHTYAQRKEGTNKENTHVLLQSGFVLIFIIHVWELVDINVVVL